MKQKIVMGNWKMNGRLDQITTLLQEILAGISANPFAQCAVFPPAVYIQHVKQLLHHQAISWGAQNVYPARAGAFTGEISGAMLSDLGCRYVLVGHSERRHLFHEDEKFVAEKFHHVKDHGMIPVLCVGETLNEREQDLTKQAILRQLVAIASIAAEQQDVFNGCVIAYEPVWAIGTGRTASPEQVQDVHHFIRQSVSQMMQSSVETLPIVYGGSVNETNARALFELPDVDGALVGGASLVAQQFVEIVKCIN